MPETLAIVINGRTHKVAVGTSAAAAVLLTGETARRSVTGEARAPLCGMGVCMECRMTIDGRANARSCQVLCREGMELATGG